MSNRLTKILLCIATFSTVLACGKKEEDTSGDKSYNLVSNVEGKASIFSNAGSKVQEVEFTGNTVKVQFPGTSTRLIGVMPALGISEGRASSVRLEVPAAQMQTAPGKDDLQGGFLYSKAAAADNPVRFEFAPMGHTASITVKGSSEAKLKGIVLSNQSSGLTGIATEDLFKVDVIHSIPGGGKQAGVTLRTPASLGSPATLFLHTACVKCTSVLFRVVLSDCYYSVSLSLPELDFSVPGITTVEIDLTGGKVLIDGQVDAGASIYKSDEGDFSSLLLLEEDDPQTDHIPDFSRVGYRYGDAPIPSPAVAATIDVASVKAALNAHTAADTTDYIQQVIDRVGSNGGGAILFKDGTYNVSRILFLDHDNTVLRGESQDGTIIKNNSTIQGPVIYMGRSVAQQASDVESESLTFVAGRRVGISYMRASGNGGSSSYGTVTIKTYSPKNPGRTYGSNSVIIEEYVPLGRLYVEVRNPNLFKSGDAVRIYRRPSQSWLEDIGMTHIAPNGRESIGAGTNQWDIDGYTMSWTRKVTAVQGNRVYLDAPVAQSLEIRYGGGELQKYSQDRATGCGVENLSIDCSYDTSVIYNGNQVDECHAWQAVLVKAAEHCWIRDVTSRHMGYALADMGSGARCITVEKCKSLSPVSSIQGARRYAFCCSAGAELCLVKECSCEYDRHSFVTNGTALGPNVFTNCQSKYAYNAIGPHWGWATATLYDCILADSNFEAQDGGNQGTGHGWRGVNTVFWNVSSSGKSIVCQSVWGTCPACGEKWNQTEICSRCGAALMPSARNYAVGVNGVKVSHTVYWDKDFYGNATTDFFVSRYGYGTNGENRPDGAWYPVRNYGSSGGDFIALPYEAPVNWWPRILTSHFTQPYSLYQCQLEDRHARGIYLNTL